MASYTPNLNLYKPDSTDDYKDFREGFNENMNKLDQGGGNANQNIAEEYDDTATYAVGDYVIYNGLLYKCDTAVTTSETFDPTKWTHVVVTDEMGSGGGGSSTLAGLSDVNLTTPSNGQVLKYNSTSQKWENANESGGGGGGGSAFVEDELVTASSFSDITVDFSTDYDEFIFYANDVTTQKSESYTYTRNEITDAINNNFGISFYPYGSSGYCQYSITRNGLQAARNSSGFYIYKIIGLKFGGGSSSYTAGDGIDITSNVISLEYLKVVNGAVNLVFDDGN